VQFWSCASTGVSTARYLPPGDLSNSIFKEARAGVEPATSGFAVLSASLRAFASGYMPLRIRAFRNDLFASSCMSLRALQEFVPRLVPIPHGAQRPRCARTDIQMSFAVPCPRVKTIVRPSRDRLG
jgi:hypothetical protein